METRPVRGPVTHVYRGWRNTKLGALIIKMAASLQWRLTYQRKLPMHDPIMSLQWRLRADHHCSLVAKRQTADR